MSGKALVGITQRVDKIKPYDELRDCLDQRYIEWVIESGFMPVPIPNTLAATNTPINHQLCLDKWLRSVKLECILLSGGNNLGEIDSRDITEKYLLQWAETNRTPVLGICRGMQMMGVYSGGKLLQVDGHVRSRHKLQFKQRGSSLLPVTVNSYHGMALERCPGQYDILAESEDNNIEAIKHKDLPWEGWMWHPEREKNFNPVDIARFKNLIDSEK